MIDKLKSKHTLEIEYQLNMEFIDFINVRLEEVNIKRKYENDTYVGYKSNINIHMKDFFGSSKNTKENEETYNKEKEQINHENNKKKQNEQYIYKVCEVTPEIIDNFFTYLSKDCKLKNTTIKHFRNQISVAYELLDKKEIMSKPTKGTEYLKEEEFTPKTYAMKELNKLLEIVKNNVIEIPFFFAAYYGLRRNEVVVLKWSVIDFENDWIYSSSIGVR